MGTRYSDYSIDDLMMFKGALTPEEIGYIYDQSIVLTSKNTINGNNELKIINKGNTIKFSEVVETVIIYDKIGRVLNKSNHTDEVVLPESSDLFIIKYVYNGNEYSRKVITHAIN